MITNSNVNSFLDAPGQNMPRQAPSPSPNAALAAQAAQQNAMPGGMGGPQTNGGVPLINGMPSGGQQTDMNHLWSVVNQLSQVLEENRAQTQGIVNGVQAIHARAADEGGLAGLGVREVNGEVNGDGNAASRATEFQTLSAQLTRAQTQAAELNASNTALAHLITDYENALGVLLEKLRPYAYNQTQIMLALHKHYQEALENERAASMQVRLEHAEWQAGLGRVAEYARMALKTQSENETPYKREIKELKEENRVLRRLAGWEEKADESTDDESDEAKFQ